MLRSPAAALGCHLALVALLIAGAAAILATSAAAEAEPPAVYIIAPSEGALLTRNASATDGFALITVTASADDSGSGVNLSTARWFLVPDYRDLSTYSSDLRTTPLNATAWLLDVDLILPDGVYQFTWFVEDYDGNGAGASVNFTLDASAPTVRVDAPKATTSLSAVVGFDIRDSMTGVRADSVQVRYRTSCGGDWKSAPYQRTALPARVVGEAVVPLCVGTSPVNSVQVGATDNAGLIAWSPIFLITVDTRPPTFSKFTPAGFVSVTDRRTPLRVTVEDSPAGVNTSSIRAQVSYNGGLTWSEWINATVDTATTGNVLVIASVNVPLPDGASVGVKWNASDAAGNGPNVSKPIFFRVNGPPFLVSVEPPEGSVFRQYESIRLFAEFADPDADSVRATFSSDIDGYLGTADGTRRALRVGVHNLTITGDDGHNHTVRYTYQIEVVARPPPDLRPLIVPVILVAGVGLAAWHTLAPQRRRREDDDKF